MAEWNAPLPKDGEPIVVGDPGHPDMHNDSVACIVELREVVDDVEAAANTAPTWASVTGKPAVIAAGADAAAARTAIGAGTSSLTLGTTSSTAKAGDYQPTWAQVTGKPTEFAPADHTHVAADVSDSSAVGRSVLTAADAAAARSAIGAGTGNSTVALVATGGNNGTATTAARSDHTHGATAAGTVTVAAIDGVTGTNVQAVLAELAARVDVLEAP